MDGLFAQHQEAICAYLARMTGDWGQAQELTQETFLRAYQALQRGEQWDNPRAWLYRTASRLAIDAHRRQRLFRWLPLLPEGKVEEGDEEEREAVQAALNVLPLKYRAPLVLYSCADYRVAEVAAILGLSVSAVKMRLARAREMFRQAYQPEVEK